jgi:hypothetical protein
MWEEGQNFSSLAEYFDDDRALTNARRCRIRHQPQFSLRQASWPGGNRSVLVDR